MKRLTLLLPWLIAGISAFAQSGPREFLNAALEPVNDEAEAEYYREVVQQDDLYCVTVYYSTGQVKMTGCFADPDFNKEEGEFVYYYRNGQVESRGMCSEGMKYGVWKRYYWDGTARPDRYYSGVTTEAALDTKLKSSPAEFPGGEAALTAYLAEKMIYPEAARNQGIEGTVEVSFIVDEYGLIVNPTVTAGAHYYLDKEAIRLVAEMPMWTPAKKGRYYVDSQFVLPVRFSLNPEQ